MNNSNQTKPLLSTDDADLRRCRTAGGFYLRSSASSADKKEVYFTSVVAALHWIMLFLIFCCLGYANAYSASDFEKILGNMGGIGLDGLPRLKWQHLDYVRETAFQIPPVLLREDASCSYVYSLDKWGYVEILKIHDKAGAFVSETRIGPTGVRQTTPEGEIEYIFK